MQRWDSGASNPNSPGRSTGTRSKSPGPDARRAGTVITRAPRARPSTPADRFVIASAWQRKQLRNSSLTAVRNPAYDRIRTMSRRYWAVAIMQTGVVRIMKKLTFALVVALATCCAGLASGKEHYREGSVKADTK